MKVTIYYSTASQHKKNEIHHRHHGHHFPGLEVARKCSVKMKIDEVVERIGADIVEVDFGKMELSARCFIDEFYNLFLSPSTREQGCVRVEAVNVPDDIEVILAAVVGSNTVYSTEHDHPFLVLTKPCNHRFFTGGLWLVRRQRITSMNGRHPKTNMWQRE